MSGSGASSSTTHPMSLWRLEWLRLVRTHRLLAIVGVYVFFGLTSPLLARYLGALIDRLGGGMQVVLPAAQPVDGFTNYISNTNQLGLLVFTLVVSSAVAFDSQREMAVFLRTRVRSYPTLLLPKYLLNVAAGAVGFVLGALATWYGTVVLIGSVPAVPVIEGMVLSVAYLAFVASLAAALGARLNSVITTTGATLAVAVALGVAGSLDEVGVWLPSNLLGSLTALVTGADLIDYGRSVVVTTVATVGLLALASYWGTRREL